MAIQVSPPEPLVIKVGVCGHARGKVSSVSVWWTCWAAEESWSIFVTTMRSLDTLMVFVRWVHGDAREVSVLLVCPRAC
jgi:hypothetical protein